MDAIFLKLQCGDSTLPSESGARNPPDDADAQFRAMTKVRATHPASRRAASGGCSYTIVRKCVCRACALLVVCTAPLSSGAGYSSCACPGTTSPSAACACLTRRQHS